MSVLEREVVKSSEHEQQRIGRDLHDGLCQQLAAIGFAARSLANDLAPVHSAQSERALKIEKFLQESIKLARDLARGICPVSCGDTALEGTMDELVRNATSLTGIDVRFQNDLGEQIVNQDAAIHLYRIAQEALNNALRHSRATSIEIKLSADGNRVKLAIIDNGIGMPAISHSRIGMGIKSMQYRSRVLGGRLEILQNSPSGSIISCIFETQQPQHEGKIHQQ